MAKHDKKYKFHLLLFHTIVQNCLSGTNIGVTKRCIALDDNPTSPNGKV